MSGGHHEEVEYEGMEKALRAYFPHNHQIVLMVMGFYTVLIGTSMAVSSAKKAAAPVPTPERPDFHTIKERSAIPSAEDDPEGWEEFISESDDNVEAWLKNMEEEE
eukprot:CAMPEP_0185573754 /NCGR_PEP_ID=MMETSP0434-20130131/5387_1 /TAXON_ID=626734 ORGANISM="Favella taraikaensis, Strain Fe Narragansett Bay" /NCGR_SAMPLE_ID=MMETSP0434 /ASSEMBLY_ACC=CAM_ASM_000379 /LENGTH=105 /DNA_ID=CAMNT_0028190085 /DNA_START=1 /DNA_END=318 /DNA_ORIENTATION=+